MNKMQGWCVGTVYAGPHRVETQGGKSGVEIIVRLKERATEDGRAYHQRIVVRSYQRDFEDLLQNLTKGSQVICHGEVDAKIHEAEAGGVFANPRIIGRIDLFESDHYPEHG